MMSQQPDPSRFFSQLLALQARAYAPYSHYQVAAILVTEDGHEFYGVNVENAAYPLTVCAERNAVANMVGGGYQKLSAIYLLAGRSNQFSTPCGACRQVIYEMAQRPETPVYVFNQMGEYRVYPINELLPLAWEF